MLKSSGLWIRLKARLFGKRVYGASTGCIVKVYTYKGNMYVTSYQKD